MSRDDLVAMMRRRRMAVIAVEPWPEFYGKDWDWRPHGFTARVGWHRRSMVEWGRTPQQAVTNALRAIESAWPEPA